MQEEIYRAAMNPQNEEPDGEETCMETGEGIPQNREENPREENPEQGHKMRVKQRLAQALGLEAPDWEQIGQALDQRQADEEQNEQKEQRLRQIGLRKRSLELHRQWEDQAQALQSLYPDFSLKEEAGNPRFAAMLEAGCTVQQAWEAMNPHRLQQRLQSDLARSAPRVREIAALPGHGPAFAATLADLSRQEREALSRRVLRGERIEIGHP